MVPSFKGFLEVECFAVLGFLEGGGVFGVSDCFGDTFLTSVELEGEEGIVDGISGEEGEPQGVMHMFGVEFDFLCVLLLLLEFDLDMGIGAGVDAEVDVVCVGVCV